MTDNEYRRLILSTRAAIMFPVAWSVITGAIAGLTTAAVWLALEMERPQVIGAVVGSVTMLISWTGGMIWWWRQWRYVRDGDKTVARPDQPKAAVRVEYHQDAGRVITIDSLEHVTPEQLRKIAVMVANGRGVTYPDILRVFGGSRTATNDFRDELIQRGYFRWRNEGSPQQGIEVTAKGRAILTHFATGARVSGDNSLNTRAHTKGEGDYEG